MSWTWMNSVLTLQSLIKFNNKIYKQANGTPVGSSISILYTEAVLLFIESRNFEETSQGNVFLKRYVDDVIDFIPKDKEENILDLINGIDHNIQFTSETEKNSKLAYTDLEMFRKDNGIFSFSVHINSTHTERMLGLLSNHAHCHKTQRAKNSSSSSKSTLQSV